MLAMFLERTELREVAGLADELIDHLLTAKIFPPPVRKSRCSRKMLWLRSEVQGFQERRKIERWTMVIKVGHFDATDVEVKIFKGQHSKAHARHYVESGRA